MEINFVSSKDSNETRIIHTNSDNIEIMMGSETDEIIEELFKSLSQRHQKRIRRVSEIIFDSVNPLHYKFHEVNLNRVGSYIPSPKFLQNKKATINLKNHEDKCFL